MGTSVAYFNCIHVLSTQIGLTCCIIDKHCKLHTYCTVLQCLCIYVVSSWVFWLLDFSNKLYYFMIYNLYLQSSAMRKGEFSLEWKPYYIAGIAEVAAFLYHFRQMRMQVALLTGAVINFLHFRNCFENHPNRK